MPITDKNIVTAPVHVEEMASFFGCRAELGTVCTSGAINKWAIYKPQSPAAHTDVSLMTLEERKADRMGLVPTEITCFKDSINQTNATVESSISEWGYKPRTTPYRIHDFLCDNTVNSNGYNHNAKPCDSGWEDMEYNINNFSESMRDSFYLLHGYSLRLTEQTATSINSADGDYMPLSYVCQLGEDMYLGVAIHLITSSGRNEWHFVIGNKSLGEAAALLSPQPTDVAPCFKTNQWLAHTIINEISGAIQLKYIPCLIVNPSKGLTQEENPKSVITVGNSTIYAMPSGDTGHLLKTTIVIDNTQSVQNGKVVYRMGGQYFIEFSDNCSAEILYMAKANRRYADSKLLGGWFLAKITRQTETGVGNINGLILVYANVVDNSRIWELATPDIDVSIPILSMRCKYNKITWDDSHMYVVKQEEVFIDKEVSGIAFSSPYDETNKSTYHSKIIDADTSNDGVKYYGCDISGMFTENKYEAGLTVEYVYTQPQ